MINNWIKFNESESSVSITEEMVQEIIFYFGESCYHDHLDEVDITFDIIYKKHNLYSIVMTEASYDEMLEYVSDLYKKSKDDKDLEESLIRLYQMIRKKLLNLPEVFEVEDIFFELIETQKFNLSIRIDDTENPVSYSIYLTLDDVTLKDFFLRVNEVEGVMKRLQKYNPSLTKCLYTEYYIEVVVELNPSK